MKNFYNDPKVYCVNVAKKHGAGFPLDKDGNAKTRLLNGEWDFKYFGSATMLDTLSAPDCNHGQAAHQRKRKHLRTLSHDFLA